MSDPGDVVINSIQLTSLSSGQTLNVVNQTVAVNLYESILDPTLYAEVLIYDSIDLLNFFPIRGEETITIEWNTPGSDERSHTFAVVKPTLLRSGTGDKEKQYSLRCITPDHLNNGKHKFSKKYKDKASNIIKSILNDQLGTDKDFQFEDTKGTQDILISKMHPFQAIDMIRRRSVSAQNQSHAFCFYENVEGYNFYTLEQLMNSRGSIGNKVYFYDATVFDSFGSVTMRNILGYRHLSLGDTTRTIQTGAFQNKVRKFDFFTKTLETVDYKNLEQQKNFKFPDSDGAPWHSETFESKYNDKTPQWFLHPHDSSRPENYMAEAIGFRQSYAAKMIQNISQIQVFGDSGLELGEVIEMKIPTMTGLTSMPEDAKLISGNYLISKIRHLISMEGRTRYEQSLELLKGSSANN